MRGKPNLLVLSNRKKGKESNKGNRQVGGEKKIAQKTKGDSPGEIQSNISAN